MNHVHGLLPHGRCVFGRLFTAAVVIGLSLQSSGRSSDMPDSSVSTDTVEPGDLHVLICAGHGVLDDLPEFLSDATSQPPARVEASGFLFVNGQYIDPPYHIQIVDTHVVINGFRLAVESYPDDAQENEAGEFELAPRRSSSGAFGNFRRFTSLQSPHPLTNRHERLRRARRDSPEPSAALLAQFAAAEICQNLEYNGLVILFDRAPLTLDNSFGTSTGLIETFARVPLSDRLNVDSPAVRPAGLNRDVWREWVGTYQPPASFVGRAEKLLQKLIETEQEGLRAIAAVKRLSDWNPSLSRLGLFLSVLVLAHLINIRPINWTDEEKHTHGRRVVLRSAILIALMSALDLAWTLLANQAGVMVEMNPIVARFIDNGHMVLAFKLVATSLAIGIVWFLRNHRAAQLAAWWGCLILAVLTVRWLSIAPTLL